jgi:subtilisin family serine protease
VPETVQRSVIIELTAAVTDLGSAAAATTSGRSRSGPTIDAEFSLVQLPKLDPVPAELKADAVDPTATAPPFVLNLDPDASTTLVRAEVDERYLDAIANRSDVVGVFSDPQIEPTVPVCPGGAARGNAADVAARLCVPDLAAAGADGSGVLLAIVDTGISLAHLQGLGLHPATDPTRSWVPQTNLTPFQFGADHGTMCAFDALIAAPRATLLDIAVLASTATGPTAMSGVLSDAVRAYRHLIDVMNAPRRPGDTRSLVVSNSWGMFHSSWDFPVGHPGNYSHNPNHPFNRIVAQLEAAGADILFAAGNCGANCPDGRCRGVTNAGIVGANSSPSVLSVAGVDVNRERAGYSTQGPGTLAWQKPDISGYTHFRGSGVYAADGGTSAATPVVAGVVAAVRTRRPFVAGMGTRTPAAIRTLLTSTADDLGASGFDFDHGFGVVDGCELATKLRARVDIVTICDRFPWLCDELSLCKRFPRLCEPRLDICRRYPWICEGLQEVEKWRIPDPGPLRRIDQLLRELERIRPAGVGAPDAVAASDDEDRPASGKGGCGCGGPCCEE